MITKLASLAFGFFFAVKPENLIFVTELIVNYKITDKEKELNTILIEILKGLE